MSDSLAFPFAITLAVSLMGVDTAVGVLPKANLSAFFEVESITATRVGNTAVLDVQRTIYQPVPMAFTVRIMERVPGGWVEFCNSPSNVILYEPDRVLPDPLTLDWWTWGKCPTLPPGEAKIITTWDPEPIGLGSLTVSAEVN